MKTRVALTALTLAAAFALAGCAAQMAGSPTTAATAQPPPTSTHSTTASSTPGSTKALAPPGAAGATKKTPPAPPVTVTQTQTQVQTRTQTQAPQQTYDPAPGRGNGTDTASADLEVQQDSAIASDMVGQWIPQLGSYQDPGGALSRFNDVLSSGYADAIMAWSGDYTSFTHPDYYVILLPRPQATAADVNSWLDGQGITADLGFAKRLSHTDGPDGNTVTR